VFVEDGAKIQRCKSFKFNLSEVMTKYSIPPPKNVVKPSETYLNMEAKFQKRAYQELLEMASEYMTQNKKKLNCMYSLDGEMLETIDDLKNFCEEADKNNIDYELNYLNVPDSLKSTHAKGPFKKKESAPAMINNNNGSPFASKITMGSLDEQESSLHRVGSIQSPDLSSLPLILKNL